MCQDGASRLTARNSIIGNERYLKAKKEKEAIVHTIEGTNFDNVFWLSDTKTFSHALSQISEVKRKMKIESKYNYLPPVTLVKSDSLSLSKDMPLEGSFNPTFIFRDPGFLLLEEVIVISSSNESEGYVPCNYVSDDKSKGYYPFLDGYEQMRDEKEYVGYTPLSYVSENESEGYSPPNYLNSHSM